MVRGRNTGLWIELALFVAAGVFLYQMGGFFLFLIPLQIIYARRDRVHFLYACGALVLVIAGVRLLSVAREAALAPTQVLLFFELAVVALLVGGLVVLNLFPRPSVRRVPRLLITTGAAAVVMIPLILWLRSRSDLTADIASAYEQLAASMSLLLSQRTPGAATLVDFEAALRLTVQLLLRSFLFVYFLLITFAWWAGTRAAARSLRPRRLHSPQADPAAPAVPARLVDFFLPEAYVWPLIGSLALILLDVALKAEIGVLAYAGWNAGLILLFLYALQAMGIIHFFFQRRSVGRGLRILFYVVLAVLLFSPRLNIVIMIALPGLGVSEIWLRYRTRTRSDSNDENHPE